MNLVHFCHNAILKINKIVSFTAKIERGKLYIDGSSHDIRAQVAEHRAQYHQNRKGIFIAKTKGLNCYDGKSSYRNNDNNPWFVLADRVLPCDTYSNTFCAHNSKPMVNNKSQIKTPQTFSRDEYQHTSGGLQYVHRLINLQRFVSTTATDDNFVEHLYDCRTKDAVATMKDHAPPSKED